MIKKLMLQFEIITMMKKTPCLLQKKYQPALFYAKKSCFDDSEAALNREFGAYSALNL
jgi:hypothetical protein